MSAHRVLDGHDACAALLASPDKGSVRVLHTASPTHDSNKLVRSRAAAAPGRAVVKKERSAMSLIRIRTKRQRKCPPREHGPPPECKPTTGRKSPDPTPARRREARRKPRQRARLQLIKVKREPPDPHEATHVRVNVPVHVPTEGKNVRADTIAAVVSSSEYDMLPTDDNTRAMHVPDKRDVPEDEMVRLRDPSAPDVKLEGEERVANDALASLCIRTSKDRPECTREVNNSWSVYAGRELRGSVSHKRNVRGCPMTPEQVYTHLTKQQSEPDGVQPVPEAQLLPPHLEDERRCAEREAAIEQDIANDNVEAMPELHKVSESFSIGFMKHIEVGRNVDIGPDGQYSFCRTGGGTDRSTKTTAAAASSGSETRAGSEQRATPPADSNSSATKTNAGGDVSRAAAGTPRGNQAAGDMHNIPLAAQTAFRRTLRDTNQSIQRAYADAGASVPREPSLRERLRGVSPHSLGGVSVRSPLMVPFTNMVRFKPLPYLFTAARDSGTPEMYKEGERPNIHLDDGTRERVRTYDTRNERAVRREVSDATNHDDFYPIVPRINRETEEKYMRQPFKGEHPCINGSKCAGQSLVGVEPIVLVMFYPLKVATEEFLRSNKQMHASRVQPNPSIATQCATRTAERSLRRSRGRESEGIQAGEKQSVQPTFCVLCYRRMAGQLLSHLTAANTTIPSNNAIVPYCNIVEVEGEYCISDCIINSDARYVGLPGPIAIHHRHMYRSVYVYRNGERAIGLEQQHKVFQSTTSMDF